MNPVDVCKQNKLAPGMWIESIYWKPAVRLIEIKDDHILIKPKGGVIRRCYSLDKNARAVPKTL